MLPITTIILGPDDYGAFALASVITSLPSSLACLGFSILLPKAFLIGNPVDLRLLISYQILISILLASLFSIFIIISWPIYVGYFPVLRSLPYIGVLLSAVSILPFTVWSIATEVITLDGRSKTFSQISIIQSLMSSLCLLICLFVFNLGGLSLFISGFVGTCLIGVGGLLCLRRYYVRIPFSWKILNVFNGAFSLTSSNLIEIFYQPLERNLLAVNSGVYSLGSYIHAQYYQNIISTLVKALSRAIWPITLAEARLPGMAFSDTKRFWQLIYVLLAIVGVAFAAFGDILIGLLTNGKFSQSGAMASMCIAWLFVAYSGRPHMGLLLANGQPSAYGRFNSISSIAAIVSAFVSIPLLGPWGAILSMYNKQIIMRVSIQIYCRRFGRLPFLDIGVVEGLFLVSFVTVLCHLRNPSIIERAEIFMLSFILVFVYHLTFAKLASSVDLLKSRNFIAFPKILH